MALIQFKGLLYNHKKEEELKSLYGDDSITAERPEILITVSTDDIVSYHQQYDDNAEILDRTDIHLRGGHSVTVHQSYEEVKIILRKYRG